MEVNLIGEALKFMVLGMGVVYLFLYIMVLAVKLQTYLIEKYFPEKPTVEATHIVDEADEEDGAHIAAIIAAVAEFRKSNNKKVSNG